MASKTEKPKTGAKVKATTPEPQGVRLAIAKVLKGQRKPLTTKEIIAKVQADPSLGKHNPEHIARMLIRDVRLQPWSFFERTAPGTYKLRPVPVRNANPWKPKPKDPKAAPKAKAKASAKGNHDPRGDVAGTKVLKVGEVKPDPKPSARKRLRDDLGNVRRTLNKVAS